LVGATQASRRTPPRRAPAIRPRSGAWSPRTTSPPAAAGSSRASAWSNCPRSLRPTPRGPRW